MTTDPSDSDYSKIIEFPKVPLNRGGGGGTSGGMEARIAALEAGVKDVSSKLDKLTDALQQNALSLAEIKGRLAESPKAAEISKLAAEIAELRGKIDGLPTFKNLGILTVAIAALAAVMPKIGKWVDRAVPF